MTNKLGSANPSRIPKPFKVMDKRAQFLVEYRTYLEICKELSDTMLPALDKGVGLDEEIKVGELFQRQKESVARLSKLGDPEKIFNTLTKGINSSTCPTFDELLEEQPTIYEVIQDLRKFKGRGGKPQDHLLVQVNGEQFKIKSPIHIFLLGIRERYKGASFHSKQALDWIWDSETFNPNEDFPTYAQGFNGLFKKSEERRFRDLVLESLNDGMYRCKIKIWFL